MYTYRRVQKAMGAWKWGHPRGQRIGIVKYETVTGRDGVLRWISSMEVCGGITAANEDRMRELYPVAWDHPIGSIHRQAYMAP